MTGFKIYSLVRALILGFLLWLIPFIVSFIVYPLKSSSPLLFESIMPVTLALVCMFFAYIYFKKVSSAYIKEGIVIGILWLAISILIDLLMFSWGPMAMTPIAYMEDIGLTYLMYPVMTIGIGYILEKKAAQR